VTPLLFNSIHLWRNSNLQQNQFRGTLPGQWSSLTKLIQLNLTSNDLTGTLPSEWSQLRSLDKLNLKNNNLTGPLPPEWSTLRSVFELNLEGNSLTGTFPDSWSEELINATLLCCEAVPQESPTEEPTPQPTAEPSPGESAPMPLWQILIIVAFSVCAFGLLVAIVTLGVFFLMKGKRRPPLSIKRKQTDEESMNIALRDFMAQTELPERAREGPKTLDSLQAPQPHATTYPPQGARYNPRSTRPSPTSTRI